MTASLSSPGRLIRWRYLWLVGAALAVLGAAIAIGNLWLLNWVHVMSGVLWTGIDLFMGFVIGPILRAVPFEARREVMTRLTPRTIFILPTLAIITGTTGWYLAGVLGYLAQPWPQYWWVAASLAIITVLTITGLGLLLPTQIRVYMELSKPEPDRARIMRLTGGYFYLIAMQGTLQVAIIVIMARFRVGL